MAALNKIRSKAALLVVVIGVALLAFIVGDFLNSGHSFFAMGKNKIATVNGEDIKPDEFSTRLKRYGNVPNGQEDEVRQSVYDEMVSSILLEQEAKKLGISVSDEELADLMSGENIHPLVHRYFGGQVTAQDVKKHIQQIFHPEENGVNVSDPQVMAQIETLRQSWIDFENDLRLVRLQEKINVLMANAAAPNKLEEAMFNEASNTSYKISYVQKPLKDIPDVDVTVSEEDLKAEYDKRKAAYKTDGGRAIKYIFVELKPSQEDYAAIETAMDSKKSDFAQKNTNMANFLNENSDVPYQDVFFTTDELLQFNDPNLTEFIKAAKTDSVSQRYFFEDRELYSCYRIMAEKEAPKTIDIRCIAFQAGSTKRDSLLSQLKAGGDFKAITKDLDPRNVADSISFAESMQAQNPLVKLVFDSKEKEKEYFKVESNGVDYIVQILQRANPVPKVKVAIWYKQVAPSEKTYTTAYNRLSSYAAGHQKAKDFIADAKNAGFELHENFCEPDEITLSKSVNEPLFGTRSVISWAFNSKKGKVSPVFELNNRGLLVVAAVDKVVKKGHIPMEYVKEELTRYVRQDKKAEKIINDLKGQTLATLDDYAKAMNAIPATGLTLTFYSNAMDPAVCGLLPSSEVNTIVGPVQGEDAVYVFTVTEEGESQQAPNESLLQEPYRKANYIEALREKAKIKNTMYRFF